MARQYICDVCGVVIKYNEVSFRISISPSNTYDNSLITVDLCRECGKKALETFGIHDRDMEPGF